MVISDIHATSLGNVQPSFHVLVGKLVEMRPEFIVITGDSVSGFQNDKMPLARVRTWWAGLEQSLEPLQQAGIPLYIIPGNHDVYTSEHRQAYTEAGLRLLGAAARFTPLHGELPYRYSADVHGVHLVFLPITSRTVPDEVLSWLEQDLATAAGARLRLVFGHIPLVSVVGRASPRAFQVRLGGPLVRGRADAYFAGHEHLVWDETITVHGQPLRTVTVGTATGGFYNPLSLGRVQQHCRGHRCLLPGTGQPFWLRPGGRTQKLTQTFTRVRVQGDQFEVIPQALRRDGRITGMGGI